MTRPRKEILIGRFSDKRRLAQVIVTIKDTVGSMSNVNTMMSKEGVDVRQSIAYAVSRPEKCAIYNAFVDLGKADLERLLTRLRGSNYVTDAVGVEAKEGALVDTLSFPVTWAGNRVVFLSKDALVGMFQHLEEIFHSAGTMIVYNEGHAYGTTMTRQVAKALGLEYLKRNFEYGIMLLSATGWGIPEVEGESKSIRSLTIVVKECFECQGNTSSSPKSHFIRGFLAGVFSELVGEPMECEEVGCTSMGDEACRFRLQIAPRAQAPGPHMAPVSTTPVR